MKRLILLTLVLVPLAASGLKPMLECPRPSQHIGPRQAPVALTAGPASETCELLGPFGATPERAKAEARDAAIKEISRWLRPAGIPASWKIPDALLAEAIQEGPIQANPRDYGLDGVVYSQVLRLDTSDRQRGRFIEAYERELAGERLVRLGGILGFVLVCLGAVSGYIRTDEATKGYYTNQLRLATVAGVGAAGYALYRFLA